MYRSITILGLVPFLLFGAEYEQPRWGGHKSPGYHTSNKSDQQRNGPQDSPLGILGAHGIFQVGSREIKVSKLYKPGIAYRSQLKVGDRITHANGKRFEEATNKPADGGLGPREGLGYAIEDSLATNHTLKLTVLRNDKPVNLKLQLPKDLKPLAKSFPYNCPRSDAVFQGLCEKLLELKGDRTHWSGPVQDATAALGLLGAGNLRWKDEIEDVAENNHNQAKNQEVHTHVIVRRVDWYIHHAR